MSKVAMITVYEYSRQPPFWVVRNDEGYWLVPAHAQGWQNRSPYVGHTNNLRELLKLPAFVAQWDI